VLVVLARPTATTGAIGPREDLRFRALVAGDADEYAARVGTDSAGTFRRRLSEGTACYGAELDGALVHASWVTTACAWTREVRAFFCVAGPSAYVYESFTHPDARGRGVYPFALAEICNDLAARSVETLWVAVESGNQPSLRAVAKAGFDERLRIGYRRRVGRLHVELPDEVKADTTVVRRRKKTRIWLTGDGASKQWKR
jgi:GNAT superfamily N-acetyltransferase